MLKVSKASDGLLREARTPRVSLAVLPGGQLWMQGPGGPTALPGRSLSRTQ